MRRSRLNFELAFADANGAPETRNAAAGLKVGDALVVVRSSAEEGTTAVQTLEGVLLGVLPAAALESYHPLVSFEGFVRSVTKEKGGQVRRLSVCLSPRKKPRRDDVVPRWEREAVDEEWLLKTRHYEAIVGCAEVHSMLKDEKLRAALRAIDGAEEKEKALHEAYDASPDVKRFFEAVLETVHDSLFS